MIQSRVTWRKTPALAVAGGLAFWAANFAISLTPLAAEYRAALSIPYLPMIAAALIGGLLIAGCVSFGLVEFYDRVPTRNAVLKALLLSFAIFVLMEIFTLYINLGNFTLYHWIGAAINLPRFVALGLAVGYLYERFN
jgi:hypothetical protein